MNYVSPFPCYQSVWNSLCILGCSFNLWLLLKSKLLRKDQILPFGFEINLACILGNFSVENHLNLFFRCPFATSIFSSSPLPLNRDRKLSIKDPNGIIRQHPFYSIGIYCIWNESNFENHNNGYNATKVIQSLSKRKWFLIRPSQPRSFKTMLKKTHGFKS